MSSQHHDDAHRDGVRMEFGLLGPVRAVSGGAPVDLGPRKQRLVLAVLLLSANRFVANTSLIRSCWLDDPPPTAHRVVHAHVSRLRGVLAGAGGAAHGISLARHGAGYVLNCDPMRVDVHRFRDLIERARANDADEQKAALLEEALALWRGEPLDDVATEKIRERLCGGLAETRLAALQERWDVRLRLGQHLSILDELVEWSAEHPRQQRITGQLMLALYRSGRATDALAVYRAYRKRMAEEFGIDPDAELQSLEVAILRADPALDLTDPAATDTRGTAVPVPAQLPPDAPGFVGRRGQLDELDAALAAGDRAARAVVISGTAGVGKTALAVHWAHRVRDRFPDGQLYVNLCGFDPAGRTMSPHEAIRGFLDALGVPGNRVPASLDAQTARYRSLLDGKRILVLLDNARDAEQVRPLLPATATVMTVVTSRNQLTSLLAVEGAHPLTLDVLSPASARALLTQRLGARRTAAEPEAVQAIIKSCAGLPLALSIATARVRQSGFSLADLAADLGTASQSLDALDAGDAASDVRAVFSWSVAAVTPPAARLFRLLGLHPGPDIAVPAAASLGGHSVPGARRLLTELTRASLLIEATPGRFSCHDLLRGYAADLAATTDPTDERRAATGRLLDHYTHTAYAADRLFNPHRDPTQIPLRPPVAGAVVEPLADVDAAVTWLAAERANLLAAVRHAADTGFDVRAWQLAQAVNTFLFRRGQWRDLVAAWRLALAAAERLGDLRAQAEAYRELGHVATMFGDHADASADLHRALDLFTRAGDLAGQARTQHNVAFMYERQDQLETALHHAQQGLVLRRAIGQPRGQAVALNGVGWCYSRLGDHAQALTHCREALALYQRVGNRYGEAAAWDSIGFAYHHLGDHVQASECYRQGIALFRESGDRYAQADSLTHLGDTRQATGDHSAARAAWIEALTLLTDLDHPDAARIRTRLHTLPLP